MAAGGVPSYHVSVNPQAVVTVNNNGSTNEKEKKPTASVCRVTVTPLIPSTSRVSHQVAPIKVHIKAICRGEKEKKESGKIFTLRNIDPTAIREVEDLKILIKVQLSSDVVDEFDVGYFEHNKVVSLRSKDDIGDLMTILQRGENTLLWCNGLQKEVQKKAFVHKRKGKHSVLVSSDSESEDTPIKRKKEDRNKKVQNQVEELKERHGQSTYTSMQYRIWAELLIGGVYSDTSEPPTHSTMFY